MKTRSWIALAGAAALATAALAQAPAADQPSSQPAATAAAEADPPAFKAEELEQMLAPVALYPDSLLSQVLMASTYPLEVVQADRWAKANKEVKDEAAAKALEAQPWDASVKSLVNFPEVLSMLSDQLEWTQKLGDAFIGQQKDVMDAVQRLRAKAKAAGNLESSKEQNVTVTQSGGTEVIVIEPSDPDVIYVPSNDTTVVYGGWAYPSYPPYPYYPPTYPLGGFGLGVACGLAWGYAWGNCDWNGGDIDIDCDRNVNRNTNINRDKAKRDMANRGAGQNGRGSFKHDSAHRGNTPYRSQADARKHGGNSARQAAQSREAYRGRAQAGQRDLAAGGASEFRGQGGRAATDRAAAGGAAASRPSTGTRPSSGSRPSTGTRDSALGGSSRGSGSSARASSSRGHSSLSSSSRGSSYRGSSYSGSRSSGSRGGSYGGSRGGGGGGRGGGGRGGGGRR